MEDQDASIDAFSSSPLFGRMSLVFLFTLYINYVVQVRPHSGPINHSDPVVDEPGLGILAV